MALAIGHRVIANSNGHGRWFAGVISDVHVQNKTQRPDATYYTVKYDDGRHDVLHRKWVKPYEAYSVQATGQRVSANDRGRGTWYPGTTIDGSKDTYTICYDDGLKELEKHMPDVKLKYSQFSVISKKKPAKSCCACSGSRFSNWSNSRLRGHITMKAFNMRCKRADLQLVLSKTPPSDFPLGEELTTEEVLAWLFCLADKVISCITRRQELTRT